MDTKGLVGTKAMDTLEFFGFISELIAEKKKKDALKLVRRAELQYGHLESYWVGRGTLEREMILIKEAKKSFRRALEINEKSPEAQQGLAEAELVENLDLEMESVTKIDKKVPWDPEAKKMVGFSAVHCLLLGINVLYETPLDEIGKNLNEIKERWNPKKYQGNAKERAEKSIEAAQDAYNRANAYFSYKKSREKKQG